MMCDQGLSKNGNQMSYYRSNFKIIILGKALVNQVSHRTELCKCFLKSMTKKMVWKWPGLQDNI